MEANWKLCKLVIQQNWITVVYIIFALLPSSQSFKYGEALSKSILYFEQQRSGILPPNQRVSWRHHSGLTDGLDHGVDLVGGYYDAGDNIKFGLPMAFTITMLSWSVIQYKEQITAAGEYQHALEAIKWGTDYFLKAHPQPHVLWAQVGNGQSDHNCWQRPEDMTTSRRAYKIDENNPGSDVAGETAAAMAAAAIIFRRANPHYSHLLLENAQQLFKFADQYRGRYDSSIPAAKKYYSSSGYMDELLWAALWLYKATGNADYLNYVIKNAEHFQGITWAIREFSWDIKYAGVQAIAAMLPMEGKYEETTNQILQEYRLKAEYYVCSCLNKSNWINVQRTPGGLLFTREWNNMQYVSTAAFLLMAYSDHLEATNRKLNCNGVQVDANEVFAFAKSQVDYILGSNPMGMSYLVGYGTTYPQKVHHRGASIVSYKDSKDPVGCVQGYEKWYERQDSNPNVLVGALVGGPNDKDKFYDKRGNYRQLEACTYNTAPLVGVFAKLHGMK